MYYPNSSDPERKALLQRADESVRRAVDSSISTAERARLQDAAEMYRLAAYKLV